MTADILPPSYTPALTSQFPSLQLIQ